MSDNARGKQGPRRRFGAIYFARDSVAIGLRYRRLIGAHAKYLQCFPGMLVAVVGHRDASEVTLSPARLGKARATAVYERLANLGVSKSRMTVASFGARMPRYAGQGTRKRASNRRVDIIYFGATEAGGSPPLRAQRPKPDAVRRRRVRAR